MASLYKNKLVSDDDLEEIFEWARDEVADFLRTLISPSSGFYRKIAPQVDSIIDVFFSGDEIVVYGSSGWLDTDYDQLGLKEKQLIVMSLIFWKEYDWFVRELPLRAGFTSQIETGFNDIDRLKRDHRFLRRMYKLFTRSLKRKYSGIYKRIQSTINREFAKEVLPYKTCLKIYYGLAEIPILSK